MFYYKTYYKDGTWSNIKSEVAITNTKEQVCSTCVGVEPKSAIWYYFQEFISLFVK